MRSAEDPQTADEVFQLACAAGRRAAEAMLERHLITVGQREDGSFNVGSFDLNELVDAVVSAALDDAGSRLPALLAAHDCPYPEGILKRIYANGISDCGHLLGACPNCKPDILALRHARRN